MACGIDNIRIGENQIPSGRVVSALEAAAHIKDVDLAIAKSYEALPEGTDFEAWSKWFQSFMKPQTTKNISQSDITSAQNNPNAEKLVNLLNLANYEHSQEYEVGNYAKRVFNRVKSNLLQRGQGLTDQQINTMLKSLQSTLTKDKVRQDMSKLRNQGLKNLKEKLGANDQLVPIIRQVLAIDPEGISAEKTEAYIRILEEFGQRKAVLSLRDTGEILSDAQQLLDGLDAEAFLKKQEASKPNEIPTHLLAATIRGKAINTSKLTSPDEIKAAKEISKYSQEELEALDERQLKNLLAGIDSINNGVFSHEILDIIISLRANKSVSPLAESISNFKAAHLEKYLAKFRGLVTKNELIHEMIRSNPLSTIDRVFGSNTRAIYKNTFEKLSKAYATYQTEAEGIVDKINAVQHKLEVAFKSPNKITEVKYLMKIYMIQREYEANQGEEHMYPAEEWLNKTIEDVNRTRHYDVNARKIMEKIKAAHPDMTAESLFKSLPAVAKEAIKEIDKINNDLVPKVLFTTGTIRGSQTKMYSFYTQHNVIRSDQEYDQYETARSDKFTSAHPSAKAGVTHERVAGVRAISLDPFSDVVSSASELLLDYHMTPVNREVIRSISRLQEQVKGKGDLQEQAAAGLEAAVKESLNNVFQGQSGRLSTIPRLLQSVKKIGFRVALASPVRATAELLSNLSFVLLDPKGDFAHGLKNYAKLSYDKNSIAVLVNLNSLQTQRLYDGGVDNNKYVDKTITSKVNQGGTVYSDRANSVIYGINVLKDLTRYRQGKSALIKAADKMVTAPDQAVSRPLWFGAFAQQFEKLTGSKPDFDKIKANDTSYMEENAAALQEATSEADKVSVRAGATNNPFSSILKFQSKGKDGKDYFKELNGYFQTFLMHEFSTAREAVYSMVGDGQMTRKEGVLTLAAVMTRMSSYGVLNALLLNMLYGALGFEDEEEDIGKMIRNDVIGSGVSLVFGRNLGGFGKGIENIIIERANMMLHGDSYDPWYDSIVYSPIGERELGYGGFSDTLVKLFAGPYTPAYKSVNKVWNSTAKAVKTSSKNKRKKEDAVSEAWKQFYFQVGAQSGLMPAARLWEKILREQQRNEKK